MNMLITSAVLEALTAHSLAIKPSKCRFAQRQVRFLGFVVSDEGISTDPSYVRGITDFPSPNDPALSVSKRVARLVSFLGIVGYYRRFCRQLATMERPLRELTLKNATWTWNSDQQQAFETIKRTISSAPVLAHPDFGRMDQFIISTDASKEGIGAVLSQIGSDGIERPIFISSRATSSTESRYAPTALECLAVVYYIEVFKFYVAGSRFTVRTDHRALQWLFSSPRSSMYLRWILRLQQYDFQVIYRPGRFNIVPDSTSRNPARTDPSEIDEPLEPLFVAQELASNISTRFNGKTTCIVCALAEDSLTPPQLDPACMQQHIDGRRHARSLAYLYGFDSQSSTLHHSPSRTVGLSSSVNNFLAHVLDGVRVPSFGPLPPPPHTPSYTLFTPPPKNGLPSCPRIAPLQEEIVYSVNLTPLFPNVVSRRSQRQRAQPKRQDDFIPWSKVDFDDKHKCTPTAILSHILNKSIKIVISILALALHRIMPSQLNKNTPTHWTLHPLVLTNFSALKTMSHL